MHRNTMLIILAAFALLGGAAIVAQTSSTGTSVSNDDGTRVEAPGTTVESDREGTRIQAPGVDITVPRDKSDD